MQRTCAVDDRFNMKRTLAALVMLGALGAWAQVYNGPPEPQAGPGPMAGPGEPNAAPYDAAHGVARISIMDGSVGVGRGDTGETVAAALNAPLMTGDRLLTAPQSRAEVQLDHSDLLRVGQQSEVRFGDLEYSRYQAQLATGTVTLTIFAGGQMQQGEIDTPSVSVRPMGPGAYRVTVNPDGTSQITVRAGQAEVYTPSGTEPLQVGQTMLARGPASDPEFQMTQAIPMDDWDEWNLSRDHQFEQESQQAYQYVSPQIDGAEDLAGAGQWVYEAPYGYVWAPTVAPGWAPYQCGRWDYENYYGWTWISYDPWGWAPYHYGRWFWGHHGWAWYPGGVGVQVWSPALVAFFGFGHGFGVGFGFGNVGWVPLAPFEAFHPWWGRGFGGGAVVANFNVYNTYRNARIMGGVTAVSAADFGRRGFTGSAMRVNANDLMHAGFVRGGVPISPSRESYRMSDRAINTSSLPRTNATRFASYGRSGGAVGAGAGSAAGRGWGRFGEPIRSGSQASGFRAGQSGGWQRFNSGAQSGSGAARAYEGSSAARGYGAGSSAYRGGSQPLRISPPVVGSRPSGGYNYAPRSFGAPAYSAPRSYSAPSYGGYSGRSYSAPSRQTNGNSGSSRSNYSAPRSSGGGGGGHASSGGGHSGGGGGGGHHR